MSKKYTDSDAKRILESEKALRFSQPGLRVVQQFYNGLKENPRDIVQESPAGVVFYNLNLCYQHGKNVSEGLIGDVAWGFRQSGIPTGLVLLGFKELAKLGYLTFTDAVGVSIITSEPNESMWYKWNPKFFELLLGKDDKEEVQISDSIKPTDTTVEKLG